MSLTDVQRLFAKRGLFHLNIKVKFAEENLPVWNYRLAGLEYKIKTSHPILVYMPIAGYQVQYNKLKGLIDMNEKFLPEWRKKIAHYQAVLKGEIEP